MILNFPALLPWLALAALPWILHLFLFRKARTLYFPSLFFLKQCAGWSRRLKLRRILLLLTRTALILYFILSLLDPQIEHAASLESSGPLFAVLDDRPAMRMKLLGRTDSFFEAYRQAAIEDLERRPHVSDAAVVLLSELALSGNLRFQSPMQAVDHLRNAAVHPLTFPAEPSLRAALDRLAPGSRLLFFSPFKLDLKDPKLSRLGPAVAPSPNFTLLSLKCPQTASINSPVTIQAVVVDQYANWADVMVRVRVDGAEMGVARAEQGIATFLLGNLSAGQHLLAVELAQSGTDGYPDDDLRMSQVTVQMDNWVGFAAPALPSSLAAALQALEVGSPDGLRLSSEEDWSGRRRIVVLDLKSVASRAQKALENGAEMFVFSDAWKSPTGSWMDLRPEQEATPASIDAGIFQNLWDALATPMDGGSNQTLTDPLNSSRHVGITRTHNLKPGAQDQVLAAFDDGMPAIIRRPAGKGSIVLTAFSIDDPALQVDPAFLMFVRGLISPPSRLNETSRRENPAFGEIPLARDAAIRIGPAAPAGPVRLVNAAHATPMTLGYSQGSFFAELPSSPHPPGLYRLLIGDEEKGKVYLHASPPAPLAIPISKEMSRVHASLSPLFFWIAVLLMAVELLLLRNMRTLAKSPTTPAG